MSVTLWLYNIELEAKMSTWSHWHFCTECYSDVGCSLDCLTEVVDGRALGGSTLCLDCSLKGRAREKAASRAADEHALASGAKSIEQLRAENGAFSFPRNRIRLNLSRTNH